MASSREHPRAARRRVRRRAARPRRASPPRARAARLPGHHLQPDRHGRAAEPAPPGRPPRSAGRGAAPAPTPALVLVLGGQPGGRRTMVAALRQREPALWVNWFCDERRTADAIRPLAAAYDARVRGRQRQVEALDDGRASRRCTTCPPGCDPSVHRPMRSRDQFRANVVFAGTATPHRERQLSELVEFGLAVWGPGWRRTQAARLLPRRAAGPRGLHPGLRRRVGGGQRPVLRGGTRAADPGCNRRLFELAAIGVPQVVEDHPDIHRHFREGSEILVARIRGRAQDARSRRRCRTGPGRSRWPPARGSGRWREHTYMHRLAALLGGGAGDGATVRVSDPASVISAPQQLPLRQHPGRQVRPEHPQVTLRHHVMGEVPLHPRAAGLRCRSRPAGPGAPPARPACHPARPPPVTRSPAATPRRVPSTGVPLTSASISVMPNGSSQSAGIHKRAGSGEQLRLRVAADAADVSHVAAETGPPPASQQQPPAGGAWRRPPPTDSPWCACSRPRKRS